MLNFEDVFNHRNILNASDRVRRKNKTAGIDKMTASESYDFFKRKYKREIVIKKLKKGTYVIHKSKKAYISKENKKKRIIKMNAMIDRVLLDCFQQSLMEKYRPLFSNAVFSYIPEIGSHQALKKWRKLVNEGYVYVLKIDLKAYFDSINQKRMLKLLSAYIDKDLLRISKRFIQMDSYKGIPQGNPISPFLSNLYLMDFDNWASSLDGIEYIRYGDDMLFLSKSSLDENHLIRCKEELKKYKVNISKEKTVFGSVEKCKFLGYTINDSELSIHLKKIEHFKADFEKKIIRLNREELNQYVNGWIAYFYMGENINLVFKWLEIYLEPVEIKQYEELANKLKVEHKL